MTTLIIHRANDTSGNRTMRDLALRLALDASQALEAQLKLMREALADAQHQIQELQQRLDRAENPTTVTGVVTSVGAMYEGGGPDPWDDPGYFDGFALFVRAADETKVYTLKKAWDWTIHPGDMLSLACTSESSCAPSVHIMSVQPGPRTEPALNWSDIVAQAEAERWNSRFPEHSWDELGADPGLDRDPGDEQPNPRAAA